MDKELIKKTLAYYETSQNELKKYASMMNQVHNEHKEYIEKVSYFIDKEVEKGKILKEHADMYKKSFYSKPSKFVEYITKNSSDIKMCSPSNKIDNKNTDPLFEFAFS